MEDRDPAYPAINEGVECRRSAARHVGEERLVGNQRSKDEVEAPGVG